MVSLIDTCISYDVSSQLKRVALCKVGVLCRNACSYGQLLGVGFSMGSSQASQTDNHSRWLKPVVQRVYA